jgi:hypothetical protein
VGGAHHPGAALVRAGATEVDRGKREAVLHGRRLIAGYAFSAPYEDVRLKAR